MTDWASLSAPEGAPGETRLTRLPLLLCGPILRRVTPRSVTVFLVTKLATTVTLTVTPHDRSGPVSLGPVLTSSKTPTVQLGQHVHVLALTAGSPTPALRADTTYVYDLALEPVSGLACTLLSEAALGPFWRAALSWSHDRRPGGGAAWPDLPSFRTPPDKIEDLRVLHGSCRKPHGKGEDMLGAMEGVIRASGPNGSADPGPRPHLLIQHGDQIYADDVADEMLVRVQDAVEHLFAWPYRESLTTPDMTPQAPAPTTERWIANISPGTRHHLIFQAAMTCGLKDPVSINALRVTAPASGRAFNDGSRDYSDEARSHLLGFGEFAAMYLFAWSPTLWGRSPKANPEIPLRMTEGSLKNQGLGSSAKNLAKHQADVESYGAAAYQVRRVLANIPVLMQFDDHEVTDDWNLTPSWVEATQDPFTVPGALGREIIRNGMAAAAVFQLWGSDPGQFSGEQPGAKALTLLNARATVTKAPKPDHSRALEWYLRMPFEFTNRQKHPEVARPATMAPTEPKLRWHYQFNEWPGLHVIVLDTRTMRAPVSSGKPFAEIINGPGIAQQVAMPASPGQNDVVFLVAPGPVFGVDVHEWVSERLGWPMTDPEHWALAPAARIRLLRETVEQFPRVDHKRTGRVVILSGDVHYASSAGVRLDAQDRTTKGPVTDSAVCTFAQFTASAQKNQGSLTYLMGHGREVLALASFGLQKTIAYALTGGAVSITGPLGLVEVGLVSITASRVVGAAATGVEKYVSMPWESDPVITGSGYLVKVEACVAPERPRSINRFATDLLGERGSVRRAWEESCQLRVVGTNNFGEVRFARGTMTQPPGATGSTNRLLAAHRIWFSLISGDPARPHTVHVVDFGQDI